MAAGVGSKIERDDYNQIQSIISPILGIAGSNPAPTITAGSFTLGVLYQIVALGSTTNAQWNSIAGTSGVTYSVGSIFKAANVGTGSGTAREVTLNYGQTISSSPVTTNSLITNVQWANLRSDILRARQHQTGTDLTNDLTVPYFEITVTGSQSGTNNLVANDTSRLSPGLPIRFFGTVFAGLSSNTTYFINQVVSTTEFKISNTRGGAVRSLLTGLGSMTAQFGGTKITEADRAAYLAMAQAAFTNRLATPPATQSSRNALYTDAYINPWNGVLSVVQTVDFTDSNAIRYFFNSGGRIEFVSERSGGTGGLKNATWTSMLSEVSGQGRIIFDYTSTRNTLTNGAAGRGTPSTNIGYYQLSTTNTLIYENPAPSGAYADNKFRIFARIDDAPGVPGSRSRLTFTLEWRDESANPNPILYGTFGPFGVDEDINGTITAVMELFYSTGNNVSIPLPTRGTTNNFTVTPITQTNTSYSISASTTSVNEGATVTFSISTVNVPNGSIVYWTNGGSTTAADFTDGVNSGSVTISNNAATLTRTLSNDLLTEGPQNLQILLRTGSTSGPIVGSSQTVTVTDTSLTPVVYNIAVSPTGTQPEGTSLLYTVTLENFGSGTLFWNNIGTTTAADFTDDVNSGSVPINNNTGSFTRNLRNDNLTEGSQTVIMTLRVGSVNGTTVATAPTVTVSDTSTNILPSYTITTNLTSISGVEQVNEGQEIQIYVETNSTVPSGFIYWGITGGGLTAADFGISNLNGSLQIVPGSTAVLRLTPSADGLTEGNETFTFTFFSDSGRTTVLSNASVGGTVTGNNRSIQIADTSRTITISPTTMPSAATRSTFSQSLSATNGDGFYSFSISSGSPPPNLAIGGSVLQGFLETAGTYSYTITARDGTGRIGTRNYSHSITANELVEGPTSNVRSRDQWFFTISGGFAFDNVDLSVNNGPYSFFGTLNADGRFQGSTNFNGATGTFTYRLRFATSGNIRILTVTSVL